MSFSIVQFADLEFAYDDPEQIARFVGTVQAHSDDPSLVVGVGDNVAPSAISLCTEGAAVQPVFEACTVAFDTLGNHDFDYGIETLTTAIVEAPQQFLCANVFDADGDRFGAQSGVLPWTTTEIDGVRLGIVGVAHPLTAAKSPPAADLTVTDPIEAVNEAIDALEDSGVDEIVCLAHLGDEENHGQGEVDDLAEQTDVDVICDGHTHGQPRIEQINGSLLCRTAGTGSDVNVLSYDGKWNAERIPCGGRAPATAIERTYHQLRTECGLTEVVDTVENPIERSLETLFFGESRLGNFVTDAYRWNGSTAVALQHSPGMRPGAALDGEITVAELIGVVPFDTAVVVATMTDEQLREVLTFGGEVHIPEHPEYWFLHVSGAAVTFDFADREIAELSVGDKPVDPAEQYTVAMPANCLEWFPVDVSAERSLGLQYEVVMEYARACGIDPSIDERLTIVNRKSTPSA